jgi:DNA-directed RNA polymerase subunit K/omega
MKHNPPALVIEYNDEMPVVNIALGEMGAEGQ